MIKKFHLLLLIMVVAVLASCSNNDYLNVIPKEATVVVSVDMASIAKKGDLGNSDLKALFSETTNTLKKEDQEKIKQFMEDPREMGIDFLSPIYVFKTPTQYVGVTMKISDDDKFGEFLDVLRSNGTCSKVSENDGLMSGTLSDCDFAYNDNTFALLFPLGQNSKAANKAALKEMFAQDKENSFVSTDAYDKMSDEKGEVLVYANMKALPEKYYPLQAFGIKNVRPGDVEMYMSALCEDGKMTLAFEMEGKTDAAKKILEDSYKNMHKIEGRYINTLTDNSILWYCAGVKGEEYIKTLKNSPQVKELFLLADRAIDVEKILGAVDGDVALTLGSMPDLNGLLGGGFNIDYIVTANVKDTKFLDDVNYWTQSMKDYGFSMTKTGDKQYAISASGFSLNWGVDDDNVYFASNGSLFQNAFSKHTNILEPYENDIKNSYVYCFVNLEAAVAPYVPFFAGQPAVSKRLSCLKSVIIRSKEEGKSELIIELKDDDTNFLKQLF